MSLKDKVLKGSISTLAAQSAKFALRILSITILARFLAPEDYGIIAIATSITMVLDIFREAGLSTATIQRPKISDLELSSMFWMNVALGLAVALASIAIAPLAHLVYNEPLLLKILPALGAVGLIHSFSVQHSAILQRNLLFGRIAVADITSQVIGLGAGIYAASQGLGVWSLVISQGTIACINTLAVALLSPWTPSLAFKYSAARPLILFGAPITAANLLNQLTRGLDALLIGYLFGPGPVGIYNRAQNILQTPLRQFISPLTHVARSAIFRTSDDNTRFINSTATALGLVSLASAILVIGALNFATHAVVILLGDKWMDCIPIFMALVPFAFMEPCASFLSSVIVAKGNSKSLLKWRLVSIAIILCGLLIGVRWGPIGMALSFSLSGLLIRMPLFLIYTCKITEIPIRKAVAFLLPCLLSGAIASTIPIYRYFSAAQDSILASIAYFILSLSLFGILLAISSKGRKLLAIVQWLSIKPKGHSSLSAIIAS